ncbi:MAG: hypothetical protein ACD_22C00221G0007 [uncultured bacterium]|nr:MAG: hypothetical protein ACD_22C00221G0007 [uncultured bacterium]
MKIYISHSNSFDYKNELYLPIRNSALNTQHSVFLPHETDTFINTKDIIKNSDLVIAEVSYPATGVGIELGWADSFGIPILCFYREGTKISGSLNVVTKVIVPYQNSEDLFTKIQSQLFTLNFL